MSGLDGIMWGWLKAAVNVVTKVAEYASWIPGPIVGGAAAVGNAVQGNWGAAARYAASAVTFGAARYISAVGKVIQKSRAFGASSKLFGRHKIGAFNRNDRLRLGWTWRGSAQKHETDDVDASGRMRPDSMKYHSKRAVRVSINEAGMYRCCAVPASGWRLSVQ